MSQCRWALRLASLAYKRWKLFFPTSVALMFVFLNSLPSFYFFAIKRFGFNYHMKLTLPLN
ncbi:hypothetical protein AtEden1_Chr5g0111131 [Arabidopsis thaliana]